MDIDKINQRFNLIENDIKENTAVIGDIQTVLMGPLPNRNNGIRGNLIILIDKYEKFVDHVNNLWHVRRREECFGLSGINDINQKIAILQKEINEMAIAKINLKGVYLMNALQFIAAILVAVIMKKM